MNTNKKKIVITASIAGLVAASATSAFAAEYPKKPENEVNYSGYVLGRFCSNNYTGWHEKKTNDTYVYHKVTAVQDAKRPTFLVEGIKGNGDSEQISPDYEQKKVNCSKLYFDKKHQDFGNKKEEVRLAMENNAVSSTRGFVSGVIDFR